jgi:hypothetical protein
VYFANASVTRTECGFDLLCFFFGNTDGALAQYKQAAAVRFAEQVLLELCLVKENSTAVVALLVPVGYNLYTSLVSSCCSVNLPSSTSSEVKSSSVYILVGKA